MKKQVDKLEANAAATKRWRTRLKRAMSMVDKLEKQRKRLEAAPKPKPVSEPVRSLAEDIVRSVLEDLPKPKVETESDTSIPSFLQRTPLDPVAAEIKAEQEATKKAKAKGRIEKLKAKQRGDLKKMPLTGKAALEMIRNG